MIRPRGIWLLHGDLPNGLGCHDSVRFCCEVIFWEPESEPVPKVPHNTEPEEPLGSWWIIRNPALIGWFRPPYSPQ